MEMQMALMTDVGSVHPMEMRVVGDVDGADDGVLLGSADGKLLGAADGLDDGDELGMLVGWVDGDAEDGIKLGLPVGSADGNADGDAVGMFVGDELGLVVGCADGDTEGLDDGAYEAVTVGLDDEQTETPMVTSWVCLSDKRTVMRRAQTKEMNYAQPKEMSLVCLLDYWMVRKTASIALHTFSSPHYSPETNNSSQ
eukprot:scaffold1896_cov140-Skeletonema_menzelii.AAC.5